MCVLWVKPFTCERGTVQEFQHDFYCTGEHYCGPNAIQNKCFNQKIQPSYLHMSDVNESLKEINICYKIPGTNSTTAGTKLNSRILRPLKTTNT